ncbi:hypothetical protein EYF80_001567 [Liparis tanakae]|uniref:Uncharacterized protein n=1 Tax=Liparis tanakae TaxID=230148 RepID=A0A4Z2JEC1_9TELE|nr:hypothetical protein EYF80_001567 [Liparis tanakae]
MHLYATESNYKTEPQLPRMGMRAAKSEPQENPYGPSGPPKRPRRSAARENSSKMFHVRHKAIRSTFNQNETVEIYHVPMMDH